jgi:hypothetical protein
MLIRLRDTNGTQFAMLMLLTFQYKNSVYRLGVFIYQDE